MGTVKQADPVAVEVAREFAKRIRALIPKAIIILYGSAARGDMEEFSDIDIYVEVPDGSDIDSIRSQVSDIAWEVGFENDKIIQAVVYLKSAVWNTPRRSSPFIKSIHIEGIAL